MYLLQQLTEAYFEEKTKVLCMDYKKCLSSVNEKFDLIFIDPPYKLDIAVNSVEIILANDLLSPDGVIVIETDEEEREIQKIKKLSNIEIINLSSRTKKGETLWTKLFIHHH